MPQRLADRIERLYADRLEPHADQLAHHALNGGRWEKAVTWLRRAGARAAARSASREAADRLEQALGVLDHLPEERERDELGIDLRLELQSALIPLGRFEEVLGCLREAETMAEALGDRRRLARVSGYLTLARWWRGELHGAIDVGRRALAIAADLGDRDAEVTANYRLGQTYIPLSAGQASDFRPHPGATSASGSVAIGLSV